MLTEMAIKCFCATCEGSGESAHLHRLTLAFVTVSKSHVLPQIAICVLFTTAAKTMVSLQNCAGIVTGQCDKYQDHKRWQRRLWQVCTYTQARLSLITVLKPHGWLMWRCCAIHSSSVDSGESAILRSHSHWTVR